MNYPLISEYIDAIKAAEDNFENLTNLRAVLGDDGQPMMTSGNFAVVFKMKDEETGKLYALKCFTKEQQGREEAYHQIAEDLKDVDSPYLVSLRYLEKELFVDTEQTDETEFPVLLMDWVEGKTLDKYLRENLDDKYALEMLAYRFSQLAQWLIPQPFAHGDLKPDNILVREDGTLVLVDYDGMYVPAMKGQKARELGSPDFRHPLRTENDFDEHIDDFPLVSILLSLKAISLNPQWLAEYGAADRLLFSLKDYLDISSCESLKIVFLSQDKDINKLIKMMMVVLCNSKLDRSFNNSLLLHTPIYDVSTIASVYEIENGILDDYGVLYSKDGLKLIKSNKYNGGTPYTYFVRDGTKVICDNAFTDTDTGSHPTTLVLPSSLSRIGRDAFESMFTPNVSELLVPDGTSKRFKQMAPQYSHLVFDISLSTTYNDTDIKEGIIDENGVVYSKDQVKLLRCNNRQFLQKYCVKDGTKVICSNAFAAETVGWDDNFYPKYESSISIVKLPNTILRLGEDAFRYCKKMHHIVIPNSCQHIGSGAFWGSSLEIITIPSSIQMIEDFAFGLCTNLKKIRFNGTPHLGYELFFQAWNLKEITIPKGSTEHFEKELPDYKDKFVEQ